MLRAQAKRDFGDTVYNSVFVSEVQNLIAKSFCNNFLAKIFDTGGNA